MQGFHTLRTSGTESPPPLYKDAAALLAQVHVEMSGVSHSVDARAGLQAALRRAIARERRATQAWWPLPPDTDTPPSGKDDEELPMLPFVPMATAPMWRLGIVASPIEQASQSPVAAIRPSSGVGRQASALSPHAEHSTVLHPHVSSSRGSDPSCQCQAGPQRHSAEVCRDTPRRSSVTPSSPVALPSSSSASVASLSARPLAASPTRLSPCASAADGEKEVAVRDYLRRMNLLSRDTPCVDQSKPETAYGDALYNGAALYQLVSAIVRHRSGVTRRVGHDVQSAMPRRPPPRSLQEVNAYYVAAMTAASTHLALPPPLLTQSPELNAEAVFVAHRLTALLDLYVYLIAHYLPPPDELPHSHTLSWQPPADSPPPSVHAVDEAGDTALYWRMERDVCGFLTDVAVLPDPDTYALPPDDYIVPEPCRAPFVSTLYGDWVPRRTAPAGLYVPSVFPYLCNGTVLCRLARRLAPRTAWSPAAAQPHTHLRGQDTSVMASSGAPRCHENPRTERTCLANLNAALDCFALLGNAVTSATRTVALELYHGYRWRFVQLLYEIHTAGVLDTTATLCTTPARGDVVHVSERAVSAPPSVECKPTVRGHSKPVIVPRTTLAQTATASSMLDRKLAALGLCAATAGEVAQLRDWLRRALGPHFVYRAEDDSFIVESDTLELRAPCLIFADGVVLAHLLRLLECRRCERLTGVVPTSKLAAKRFNVRQCLRFLQDEKGVVLAEPLFEEALLYGALDGVCHILRVLRRSYRLAHCSRLC